MRRWSARSGREPSAGVAGVCAVSRARPATAPDAGVRWVRAGQHRPDDPPGASTRSVDDESRRRHAGPPAAGLRAATGPSAVDRGPWAARLVMVCGRRRPRTVRGRAWPRRPCARGRRRGSRRRWRHAATAFGPSTCEATATSMRATVGWPTGLTDALWSCTPPQWSSCPRAASTGGTAQVLDPRVYGVLRYPSIAPPQPGPRTMRSPGLAGWPICQGFAPCASTVTNGGSSCGRSSNSQRAPTAIGVRALERKPRRAAIGFSDLRSVGAGDVDQRCRHSPLRPSSPAVAAGAGNRSSRSPRSKADSKTPTPGIVTATMPSAPGSPLA